MHTSSHRTEQARIAEQAAQWISDLQESDDRRDAFFDWLRASPRHVEESLFVLALSREASLLDKDRSDALIADVKRTGLMDTENVVPLDPHAAHREPAARVTRFGSFTRGKASAGLAAAAALAAVLSWVFLMPSTQEYSTRVGEQQTFALEDGSVVQLNTRSRVSVRYSATGRSLRLLEGEALFTVRRDPQRPFRVHTRDSVVEVLGTQFNVYQQPGKTSIAVTEGLVQVSGTRVTAGEQVDVSGGQVGQPTALDTKALAWRQRRLVFENDTLAVIAAEFNRYNTKVRLQADAGVAEERFTGTFDADTPETFVQAAAANGSVKIERLRDRILLRNGPRN